MDVNGDPQYAGQEADFDFWEYVSCACCHLPFVTNGTNQPSVPFWVTDCGHVVCNSHLNADQSCASCKAPNAEVMPLQKEMPAPMSDWFCHIPYKLDALAQASRFQLESMSASLRYYRTRCTQYRSLLDRLKNEAAIAKALRKEVEILRNENEQLRAGQGIAGPSRQAPTQQVANINGKRPRLDPYAGSISSPRSIHTPLGPSRITLPPDQEPPQLLPGVKGHISDSTQRRPPGSSQFVERFAYNPPQATDNFLPQALSHVQQGPTRSNARSGMLPPPTPAHARQSRDIGGLSHPEARMGPQQLHRQALTQAQTRNAVQTVQRGQNTSGHAVLPQSTSMPTASNHGVQESGFARRFMPATPAAAGSSAHKRFIPPTPSASTSQNATANFSGLGHTHAQPQLLLPSRISSATGNLKNGLTDISATGTRGRPQQQRSAFVPTSRTGFS